MTSKKLYHAECITHLITFLITVIATIAILIILDPIIHFKTFTMTLFLILIMEVLFFGYSIIMFIPSIYSKLQSVIYISIGYAIGIYIAFNMATILIYHVAHKFINERIYYSILIVEGLLLFIATCFLLIVNFYKKKEDETSAYNLSATKNIASTVHTLYNNFFLLKGRFDEVDFKNIEQALKQLQERFYYCTPFGRREITDIDETILSEISKLSATIHKLLECEKHAIKENIDILENTVKNIHCLMDNREIKVKKSCS